MTAVWVGYPKERTIYVDGRAGFGGTVAAPIWASFMQRALAGKPMSDFPKAGEPKYDADKFDIPVSKPPSVNGHAASTRRGKKLDG